MDLNKLSFNISSQGETLKSLEIVDSKKDLDREYSDFDEKVYKELLEYFNGERKSFDIKLSPKGTDFEKRVFWEIYKIPYGEVTTYKDIAIKLGNPNLSRAVGNACGKNPIPIIIPCHRVLGSNGKLGGYKLGLDLKKELLSLEKEESDECI